MTASNTLSNEVGTIMVGQFEIDPKKIKDGYFKGWCRYHYNGKTTKGQVDDCYAFLRIISDNGTYFLLDKESLKAFAGGFDQYKGKAGALKKEFITDLVDHFANEQAEAEANLAKANDAVVGVYTSAMDNLLATQSNDHTRKGLSEQASKSYNDLLALVKPFSEAVFVAYANK